MQSKKDSLIEAAIGVLIGLLVGLGAQMLWYPIVGKHFTLAENVATTIFFTLVGFVRTYVIRRLFNGRPVYETIKKKFSN